MNQAKIFDRLCVSYPDSFHVMDAQEMKKYFIDDAGRWGIRDDDKHITISVLKSASSKFLIMLADLKAVIKRAEFDMNRNLKDYQKIKNIEMTLLGKSARGVAFTFTTTKSAEKMYGEIICVKIGGMLYTFYFTSRDGETAVNHPAFNSFLTSSYIQ